MSDGWSLKGKEISLDFNRRLLGQTKEDEIISVKVIPSRHVEILHQKLIEDVTEKLDAGGDWVEASWWVILNGVKNIINKRFGVKK